MTIDRVEPTALVAVCDKCGDRHILDLDRDADDETISAELTYQGWKHRKPERKRFAHASPTYTEVYEQDFCADCRTGERGPKPRMKGLPRGWTPSVGIVNDPCDEWPRASIFKALGLHPMCGHPTRDIDCEFCHAGHPIGRIVPFWRR